MTLPRNAIIGLLSLAALFASPPDASAAGEIRKTGDVVVYQDDLYYSAFPSIVRRPDGELIVAFRRAPDRRSLGEGGNSHTDPNSYLVLVRSKDGGKTWTKEPELFYAHPLGGSQDPCLLQLRDGGLLCASYGWSLLDPAAAAKSPASARAGNFMFLGGYLVRSDDGGARWFGPIIPPPLPGSTAKGPLGEPLAAYNRGAMCQGRDGKIYWVVAHPMEPDHKRTATHLLVSQDRGATWSYSAPVASDPKIEFNESSIIETPKGDLVAFIRSENFNDHTVIARSSDGGKSFKWADAGFQGHPHYALQLPDGRVLLVYGYRHPPFGVRARVLGPECEDAAAAPELVLRDDGGNGDLGYPWAAMADDKTALVVYYFNVADGRRQIGGTFLSVD